MLLKSQFIKMDTQIKIDDSNDIDDNIANIAKLIKDGDYVDDKKIINRKNALCFKNE
jgi:hypothetical protein